MSRTQQAICFFVAALVSVVIKVSLASLAHNYDVDSYVIVADHVRAGHTVYAATERYNYAPAWSYVVAGVRSLQMLLFPNDADGGVRMFHVMIAVLLAYVDLLMALWLAKHHGLAAGFVMLCNPVSWLLTGFHSQFDNLAVYVGLLGCGLALGKEGERISTGRFLAGVGLMGLSLITKHILIFFPLWCFVRAGISWPRKLAILFVPAGLFLASFLPFVSDPAALKGIRENVFAYEAYKLTGFLPHAIGCFGSVQALDKALAFIPVVGGFKFVWLATLCLCGLLLRRVPVEHAALYYLTAMVVLSGQVMDQYLAIPLVACAVFCRSPLMWGYLAVSLFYLLGSSANIGTVDGFEWLALWPHRLGIEAWWPLCFLFVFLLASGVQYVRIRPSLTSDRPVEDA